MPANENVVSGLAYPIVVNPMASVHSVGPTSFSALFRLTETKNVYWVSFWERISCYPWDMREFQRLTLHPSTIPTMNTTTSLVYFSFLARKIKSGIHAFFTLCQGLSVSCSHSCINCGLNFHFSVHFDDMYYGFNTLS